MAQREVHESDTESVMTVPEGGFDDDLAEEDGVGSEGELQALSEEEEDDEVPFRLPGVATLRVAFASLDVVNLTEEFDQPASVLKTFPHFLKGPYRIAMRVALQEIEEGSRGVEPVREERGWKLFLLLPRMMLHRPPRGGLIPRSKLIHRFELFVSGRWTELLAASEACCQQAAISRRRRSRRVEDDITRRLDRADSLVHMGELSSARQALEGASLAPGTEATLNALRDPEKRPRVPREPLPRELVSHVPAFQFNLDADQFARNVRSARRGAAGGPSGMTVEHLQPLLTVPRDVRAFHHVAERLSRGQVPSSIRDAIRLGRLTALRKSNGGVRGIVAGDIVRRLVARTISQQMAEAVQTATAPFQYALSTRSGCECVAHALQGLTEIDPRATVTSIDGISAYDLISRQAMLEGLREMPGGASILPFVSLFYGGPSSYLWKDALGRVHTIVQGEGGEQGDALMPLLFSLGQHKALLMSSGTVEERRISDGILGRHLCGHSA